MLGVKSICESIQPFPRYRIGDLILVGRLCKSHQLNETSNKMGFLRTSQNPETRKRKFPQEDWANSQKIHKKSARHVYVLVLP